MNYVVEIVSSSADRMGRLDQLGVVRGWKARLSLCFLGVGSRVVFWFFFFGFWFCFISIYSLFCFSGCKVSHGPEVEKCDGFILLILIFLKMAGKIGPLVRTIGGSEKKLMFSHV
jgi:hypothetical protein